MTNQSQALAPVSATEWEMMKEQAEMLLETGFLPTAIERPEQAVAIMLKGRELGIPPMYALANIAVIKGKPTANAELMLALIYRDHGDNAIYNIRTDHEVAEYAYKRKSWSEYRRFSFTIHDARRAGIMGNQTWSKYPAAMLRARCISAIARLAFPDSIGGMYTPEELGVVDEIDEDGEQRMVVRPEDMVPRIVEEPERTMLHFTDGPPTDLPVEDGEWTEPATEPIEVEALSLEDLFNEPTPAPAPTPAPKAAPKAAPAPTPASESAPTAAYDWDEFSQDVFYAMEKLGAAEKLRNTVLDLIYKDLEHDGTRNDPVVLRQVLGEVSTWTKVQDVTMFATDLANKRRATSGRR